MTALAAEAPLSPDERTQLAAALQPGAGLSDVDYTYQITATYWVEPQTGTVLKTDQREIQRVGPVLSDQTLAVVPIYDVSLASTAASVEEAAARAAAAKERIRLYGTAAPWILVAFGVTGIVAGTLLMARRRMRVPQTPAMAGSGLGRPVRSGRL